MNRRRFLLYFLIVMAVLIMICTAIALLVSIKESVKAEAQVKELTFEEQVENMIQTHKIMMDRLIAAWEHRKEEVYLIAEVIFWENWFTDPEHLAAYYSGAVVMNRVKSPLWPDTVRALFTKKDSTVLQSIFIQRNSRRKYTKWHGTYIGTGHRTSRTMWFFRQHLNKDPETG